MADPEVRARHAAAMADPEVRARHAAAMADPEVRARHGWLSPQEREQVIAAIKSGRRYIDIALDWLLSPGRVAQIAREEGLQRRPRKLRAIEAAE